MSASAPSEERAVITGLGVVAPTGIGTDAWWKATLAGTSGIGRITRFDPSKYATQLAGEVSDFEATDFIDNRLIAQTDRWTWMAMAAAQMALDDAKVDPAGLDPYRMSVITASASGGNEFGQREIQNLWGKGPIFVGAYQSIAWFYAATTGQISIKYGMKGPCGVLVSEGAGGLEALWHSRRTIRRGVDVVVSGGTEAPVGPFALTCQQQSARLERGARAGGRVPAVRPARQRLRARRGRRDHHRRGRGARASSGARRRSTARSSATPRRTTPRIRSARRRTAATSRAPSSSRSNGPASARTTSTRSSRTRPASPSPIGPRPTRSRPSSAGAASPSRRRSR